MGTLHELLPHMMLVIRGAYGHSSCVTFAHDANEWRCLWALVTRYLRT